MIFYLTCYSKIQHLSSLVRSFVLLVQIGMLCDTTTRKTMLKHHSHTHTVFLYRNARKVIYDGQPATPTTTTEMMVLSEDYSKLTLFNEDCCVYSNVFRVVFCVFVSFLFIDTHAMMHVFVDNVIIFDLSTQIILHTAN